MFEYLEHDADIGIFVKSETKEEIFLESFLSLKDYSYEIVTNDFDKRNSIYKKDEFKIEYKILKYLLHDYLSKILYLIDIGNYVTKIYEIEIKDDFAIFKYEYVDNKKDMKIEYKNQVKAITNHKLDFIKEGNFYIATVFFDI